MKLWHPSTELPVRDRASCLFALPPSDGDDTWCLAPEFFTWYATYGHWRGEDSADLRQPGDPVWWCYEADVLAELTAPTLAAGAAALPPEGAAAGLGAARHPTAPPPTLVTPSPGAPDDD